MGWLKFSTWEIWREVLRLAVFILAGLILVGLLALAVSATTTEPDMKNWELFMEKPDYPALPKEHQVTTMKPYGPNNIAGCPFMLLAATGVLGMIIGGHWRRVRHWIMGNHKIRMYRP
jgi:hypothetical protein